MCMIFLGESIKFNKVDTPTSGVHWNWWRFAQILKETQKIVDS